MRTIEVNISGSWSQVAQVNSSLTADVLTSIVPGTAFRVLQDGAPYVDGNGAKEWTATGAAYQPSDAYGQWAIPSVDALGNESSFCL